MKKISAYLSNYTAPSSGFSEGRLKDDPGDGTGSGITVSTHNDFLYGFLAPIMKWLGAVSETDESETASDMLTAIERAAGVANENVSNWSNSTTYAQDDQVMYLGVQYVSMAAGNVGNNPIDKPLKWLPCFGRDEALRLYRDGTDLPGGFSNIHNHRDTTYFREYFKWGKYNFGGSAGRNFQAYGVHLNGQIITGNPTYVAIFNIGDTDQYPLLDVIAPDVLGTRTLLDTKGRVPRCVDATGGSSVAVGLKQEDQFQGVEYFIQAGTASFGYAIQPGIPGSIGSNMQRTSIGDNNGVTSSGFRTAAPHDAGYGVPRIGTETRMKNYSVGLRSVLVLVEI